MEKAFVIKIGKLYVGREYQGSNPKSPRFSFIEDSHRAKRFCKSDGLEYAKVIAEQLDGQVYEVQTTVELREV